LNVVAAVSLIVNVVLLAVALATINNDRWREMWAARPFGAKPPEIVVGVVRRGDEVLLVHRKPAMKSRLHWQFPSGHIGAANDLHQRVLREIVEETGIVARVVSELGRRRHPMTGKRCVYFLCDYVSGAEINADPAENIFVAWVGKAEVEAYMGGRLYSKVKQAL
jgi:8-oxo-dGTP diphosphatase